jgi:hypothetical protein
MGIRIGLAAALLTVVSGAADAQQVEVLFSHKHWKVSGVAWDDGTMGCVAEVSAPGESFSIWTLQDGSVSLQFYSTAWSFAEGETADLQVQIDRRAPWTLNSANLAENSVYFDIPGSEDGINFISEIQRGNRLYLRSADGSDVQNYSLSGSSASINALLECGVYISDPSPGNPFN